MFLFEKCLFDELTKIRLEYNFYLSWEIIDKDYIWKNDCYLYKILDNKQNVIALLYYDVDDYMNINKFEVLEEYRNKGIGTKIMQQFFQQFEIEVDKIRLEPASEEACSFWNKLGINCVFI
ncbi:MAG: GNAT family N-acetyltransferase [Eubacteriales bacterium]|nr:GNAT family N-acetyltransferase [Lachnospiraceae bacterium]MDO4976678.1 GNAT family N-acetyltransferase [Eubacteriales bacterium]